MLSIAGVLVDFRTAEAIRVLELLNEVAGWEYYGQRERQHAGIATAKQDGRYKGRKAILQPEDVRQRLQAGQRPSAVARELGIARSSVYRLGGDSVISHPVHSL